MGNFSWKKLGFAMGIGAIVGGLKGLIESIIKLHKTNKEIKELDEEWNELIDKYDRIISIENQRYIHAANVEGCPEDLRDCLLEYVALNTEFSNKLHKRDEYDAKEFIKVIEPYKSMAEAQGFELRFLLMKYGILTE